MPLPLSSQAANVTVSDCTPASAAALRMQYIVIYVVIVIIDIYVKDNQLHSSLSSSPAHANSNFACQQPVTCGFQLSCRNAL
jgi:hypothetical protein